MATNISANYDRFYQGSKMIESRGSASKGKGVVERYQFNTTDKDGNHIMDKMSKEESFRVMDEIASRYANDDVVVEFSGDGLTAFEEYKGKMKLPEDHKEIPEEMMTYFDGPEPFNAEQLDMINRSPGHDDEAIMRRIDPDAYEEFLSVRKAGEEDGTLEGALAGAKYVLKWSLEQSHKNPNRMDQERETQKALNEMSNRFRNAEFFIGSADKYSLSGDREFSVILSKEEFNILKNGSDEEKDKIYQLIEESIKKLSDMKNSHGDEELFKGVNFGVSVEKDDAILFLAQSKNQSFVADSIDDLLEKLRVNGSQEKETI